jgi:hypothetical protein
MHKQGNIGRYADDKLGAEKLDWSGRQRRANAVPPNFIENHRQTATHPAGHPC